MSQPEPLAPTLETVWATVDELWPAGLAEDWDAVGPVTGDPEQPVKCIVMAVDPTLAVVDDAIERGADLLITHHPLLLRPSEMSTAGKRTRRSLSLMLFSTFLECVFVQVIRRGAGTTTRRVKTW
jgi:putative NIF3 family GTP cyclohydrolase 1 type 2